MYYHAATINNNNNNYNKSSSYPNFVPSANSTILNNAVALTDAVQRSLQAIGQKKFQPMITPAQNNVTSANMSQDPLSNLVYRHSLNNLISLQHIQQQQQQLHQPTHSKPRIQSIKFSDSLGSKVSSGDSNSTTISNGITMPQDLIRIGTRENSQKFEGKWSCGDAGGANQSQNSVCDINSRLEFLCLQMTDRLIN